MSSLVTSTDTPRQRPWLNDKYRAELAASFDCAPCDVERCLDARERMEAYIAERREREYPCNSASAWRS